MKTLWWRIRFTIRFVGVFWKFQGYHIAFGWKISKSTKYKHMTPYMAVLHEIADWYS